MLFFCVTFLLIVIIWFGCELCFRVIENAGCCIYVTLVNMSRRLEIELR